MDTAHTCAPETSREAHPGRYAGTVTSPFLFTGTLLDPEGLYDEEVCTPDNLQKYAIPNPPPPLDNSFKSQFIACSLTFHKLRGVSWTLKKKKQNQSKQNPNQP